MSPRLKKILKLILVVGFLLLFFVYVPVQKIYLSLISANLFLFGLAVLMGFPNIFMSTLSTWVLARWQGIQIPLTEFYLFNLSIKFYGFLSPVSAVSTGLRWHKLSAGGKGAEAISAIALTRLISILTAVSMGIFWAVTSVDQDFIAPMYFVLFLIVLILGWIFLARLSPTLAANLKNKSDSVHQPWVKKGIVFLGRLFASITVYAKLPLSMLVLIAVINLFNEILGIITHVMIAQALQIPLSLTDLGWLRAISFLSSLAPFTLAGGFGLREVSLVVILSTFDISPDLAAAYSFLIYARGVIFSLVCGMMELTLLLKSK
jgi:glycosyltransferase 2 family protein